MPARARRRAATARRRPRDLGRDRASRRRPALATAAQNEQLLRPCARAGRPRRSQRRSRASAGPEAERLGLLQPQPQPGQRRPQLMRGVGDEVALRAEQPRDPVGHLVERAGERALLAAALELGARRVRSPCATRRATASRRPSGRPTLRRDQRPGEQAEREHDQRDQPEAELDALHGAVQRRDALRDPHRADRAGRCG